MDEYVLKKICVFHSFIFTLNYNLIFIGKFSRENATIHDYSWEMDSWKIFGLLVSNFELRKLLLISLVTVQAITSNFEFQYKFEPETE